jgi:type I restriction enzyme, S subunit
MKFRKEKWEKVPVGNLCNNVSKVLKKNMIGEFNYIEIGSINSNTNIIEKYEKIKWDSASPNAKQVVYKDDVLCSTVRVNLKKIAIINEDVENCIATVGFCVLRPNKEKISPQFLFQVCLSEYFTNNLLLTSSGTTYPIVKNKDVLSIKIPLPSLEEQKQIASLFHSFETAIEQVEKQENYLINFRRILCCGLVCIKPVLGKLLNDKNCSLTNFGEISDCIEQHDKEKKEVNRFIGLEHIEPENLTTSAWGDVEKGTTFTKKFSKGDVLFGKRRAYLKKVAVADFDGICSGDILVIRAKEGKILPELLTFYIMSESFINHAISTSAGSLSPRTKWKDLSKLEFSIPDIDTQKIILKVFEQIQLTLSQLKVQKQNLNNLKQKLLDEIFG